ncbi:AraC family transcriptional regulator [Pseudophaeobacter sp.]|uniref:AraC family transcriptional regulator n=1 Tax=Pseudophaeobacter sp. TaxID=1971739 RepID=UPI00262285BE|nr:AraC family transcriptional regulator [Pseudophaeobacter sp.]
MTSVSTLYARKQIEHADQIADKGKLLDLVGLTPETLADPTVMVPVETYHDLMEVVAKSEFPDLRFHMKTCRSMRCDEFGVFGLALKSAPTLRHGFQRIWRYTRLHNRVASFSAAQEGDRFCWSMQAPKTDRLGAFLSIEAAMGTTLTLCRETTSPEFQPCHVQFVHERDGSIDALVEHFGCVPEFGARSDALHFDVQDVDQPSSIGDTGVWNFLISHLEQMLEKERDQEQSFEAQVIEEIAKLLSGGVPQLSEVAKNMGLGGRTFQRRLSERGHSFQSLTDESRRKLAQQLIQSSNYSFSEIAFLTGFSEQSAFSRAFKRWSGQTPKAYRSGLRDSSAATSCPAE